MTTAIGRVGHALTLAITMALFALGASAAQGAVGYVHETLPEFEAQLKAGQIREATINRRLRSLRLALSDGRHVRVQYHPGEEPRVRSELEAKHVAVSVLTPAQANKEHVKKAVHHKLRYIAGGIVVAVIVIVGGVMLYNRRRRPPSA
jgi:hypothetical protein